MSDLAATSRIFLLRHARSGWAAPGKRDFDRTLDAQGQEDAGRIGLAMAVNGYAPVRILCSSARRCVETWQIVSRHVNASDVVFTDDLYANDHHVYIDLIRDQADAASVMLLGHNPMMENTAHCLLTRRNENEADVLRRGFPTAGLAIVDLEGQLRDAARSPSRLAGFLTPQDV
jgi:phosphohistidine phosphatase